ncbi:MAG: hypothetical protein Q9222_005099, partial [Ikaeria aurantiellina]
HERQWWDGRQALLRTLSTRDSNKKKLADVLASISGAASAAAVAEVETKKEKKNSEGDGDGDGGAKEEQDKELRDYDKKVHKAYTEMCAATFKDLKRMGIPFFCIDEAECVGEGEGEEGKVGKSELERLRGRMVGFLEDMVGE